jgi:hypothetical protein
MSTIPTIPVTDPTPVPVDPTNDKLYALLTAAVMAVANAVILFVHVTDAQKGAILLAVDAVAAVVAYIFISSHRTNVQANATIKAAHFTAMLYRRIP